MVKVSTISKKGRMGGPLTDKERNVLKELKKITQDEIDKMDVDDIPTSWRLSCQMLIRDEDILVEY